MLLSALMAGCGNAANAQAGSESAQDAATEADTVAQTADADFATDQIASTEDDTIIHQSNHESDVTTEDDVKNDGDEEAKAEPSETASADSTETAEESKGSPEYDQLVSQTINNSSTMTLSEDANAVIDIAFVQDFTLDCAGHDITISGQISLAPIHNFTMTIVDPDKVDLSNLKFLKSPDISVDPDTDFVLVVKGEDLDLTPPADVPPGSRKESSTGFYCETKASSVSIRYRVP